jgi:hypothetical protein
MGTEVWCEGILMEFVKQFDIPDFDEHKEKLMLAIDMVKSNYKCQYSKMSYSDYKVDYGDNRPLYREMVISLCEEYFKEYMSSWYCTEYNVNSMWFAEYHDGADFGWHTHEGCNMSAVLQVELDNEQDGTEVLGVKTKLKEGSLVIFPAMMPHRGPTVNEGNKIVIGMNWNMYGSTLNGE